MKLKSNKKPNPFSRKILIAFRVDAEEMRLIEKNAKKFSNQNVSEWIRFSSLNFKPKKEDLE